MAQDGGHVSPAEYADIELMAEQTGASVEELLLHQEIRPSVLELERSLLEEVNFAGLWYSWDPLRVNVAFANDTSSARSLLDRFARPDLLVEHEVKWSLSQLMSALDDVFDARDEADVEMSGGISVRNNMVYATTRTAAERDALRNSFFAIHEHHRDPSDGGMVSFGVSDLGGPDYKGGHPTGGGCTAGFVIQSGSAHGFMTAGHLTCKDPYPYQGRNVSVLWWSVQGQRDVSIHQMLGGTPENRIAIDNDPSRAITSRKGWHDVSDGDVVCKHGKTTGTTCNWIIEKHYSPQWVTNGKWFIRATGTHFVHCAPGDSGGPVFNGNAAIGIHSGRAPEGGCVFNMQDLALQNTGWAVKTTK